MAKKNALRLHLVDKFASAGLATLASERCPVDQVWYIQRYVFEGDKTTSGGNTRARVYIGGRGPLFYVHEQDAPAAGTLYEDRDPNWVYPGEWLALEWDQAQADTTLNLYIHGWYIPIYDDAPLA